MVIIMKIKEIKRERRNVSQVEYFAIHVVKGETSDAWQSAFDLLERHGICIESYEEQENDTDWPYGSALFEIESIRDATFNEINAHHYLQLDKNCNGEGIDCNKCVLWDVVERECAMYTKNYESIIIRCKKELARKEVIP